jgi:hypothetical protein
MVNQHNKTIQRGEWQVLMKSNMATG